METHDQIIFKVTRHAEAYLHASDMVVESYCGRSDNVCKEVNCFSEGSTWTVFPFSSAAGAAAANSSSGDIVYYSE